MPNINIFKFYNVSMDVVDMYELEGHIQQRLIWSGRVFQMNTDQREVHRKPCIPEPAEQCGINAKTGLNSAIGRSGFNRWHEACRRDGETGLVIRKI